jgi:hypothetical protein
MPYQPEAYNVLRSYLPESYLINRRDAGALTHKYFVRGLRLRGIVRPIVLTFPGIWANQSPDNSLSYRRTKQLGGLQVEVPETLPVSAYDGQYGVGFDMQSADMALMLHVDNITGVQHMRQQLALSARYIAAHDTLRSRRLVLGVTYREMGRLATRFGFRSLHIDCVDDDYEASARVEHQAFCAVNRVTRPFELAAVYLPTAEFVRRFGCN